MSLLYWLPMVTDSLENQGLSTATATNYSTTVVGGKLGKCRSFNGSSYIDTGFVNPFSTGDFSLACWFKITETSGKTSQALINCKNSISRDVGCCIYWNQNQKKFFWSTGDGSSSVEKWTANTFEDSEIYDKWHHIVMIRKANDSKHGYIFLDGVRYELASIPNIVNISSTNSFYIGGVQNKQDVCYFTGSICDVRIYNHALSECEIHLLAQGLVVHYPLSVGGQPNLLKNVSGVGRKNSNTCTVTTQENISVSEWGTDKATRVYGTQTNISAIFYVFGGGSNSAYINCDSPITVRDQKYTYSVYIKNNHSTNSLVVYPNLSVFYQSVTVAPNKSIKAVMTGVGNGSSYIQINLKTTAEDFDFTWYHPKAEYGEVCTPWMPATSDTEYHTMGFDSNIEYDVSGLKHNMTMNNVEVVPDTPRYNTAYKFDSSYGVSDEILPSGQIFNEFTMSFWMKLDQSAPNMYVLYYGIVTLSKNASYSSLMITATVSNQDGTSTTEYSWVDNNTFSDLYDYQWHHVCYTFKDGIFKVYVDGTYKAYSNRTQYGTYIKAKGNKVLGANDVYGNPYKGCLSDFRIYATELSADDVQRLYSSPISISNNGTLLTNSIDEN